MCGSLAPPKPPTFQFLEIGNRMNFTIESELEEDGRWLAEVMEIPGVLAYGYTPTEAIAKAQALALRAIADRARYRAQTG